jgi:hypothetical protein
LIPIVGVSLEEALLGFGGDDDADSGGLTLDYIISNGYALYAEPIQIAKDTVLESTLADYSVNLFMVRDGAQLAQVQNIGSKTAGYKDTFARQTNYWYRTYAVYYVNGVPTWGQEVYISSTNAHRDVFNEEYYTWTGGASEGDFFYAVLPSSNQVIDLTYITSGVYEIAFNISNMSNGYIMLIPRKTGGSYLDIPVNYTYYYYTTYNDRAPELNRETHSTSTQNPSVSIKFPYVDTNYRESYDIITNGMSRDAVNDLIMSISAEIYQFYLSL